MFYKMNRITFLFSIMLFSIVEGRFFKVPPKNLKSQSASDIAPTNPYSQADYKGFIYHESAEVRNNKEDAIEDASKIIRKAVAAGLRQHFGKLQSIITAFADDDGFVREGIVYCGASEQAYDKNLETRLEFTVNDTTPENFSPNSARLIEYDGWGTVVDNNDQIAYDSQQCGTNNCQEGSVISAMAAEIRSTGYQIQHKDICLADANSVKLDARSANLRSYATKPAILCNGTDGEAWFDKLRDCIGASISNCGPGCSANANDAEFVDEMCWVNPNDQINCRVVKQNENKADENIVGEANINGIRRIMRYSLNQDIAAVQTTDYAYITGCTAGNCTSLRNLFAALNGNAQISAFRDLGTGESIAYWEAEIKSAKTYLQGLADTFRNFRPITMHIFPFIEEEEIEGCPMGEVEKTPEDTGSEVSPLCYQQSLDINDLNKLSKDGQFISRSSCFCRNGKLDDSFINIEKDDIYLSVLDSEVVKSECDNMPTSVRTYCREIGSWGERGPWKATLMSLLPPSTIGRVKIYDENPSAHHVKRQTIINNLVHTLPSELDTSCGRIVNADSSMYTNSSKMFRSNKGGNCLPFNKLYDVIYKLEYETGEQGMGMYKCDIDNSCINQTIEESFCADKLETTELSFRQLAYKWDIADPNLATRVISPDIFKGNFNASFGGGFLTYTGENYVESSTVTIERTFCLVDWLSEFGLNPITDAGGHFHSDPFTAIKKYIDEAVFNTELAQSAKTKVISDNIDIWKAIRKELTTPEDANILDDIAVAAAKHYLYIMTTDVDDVIANTQETFREGARVRKQIADFTKEIQPLALQLPTLVTALDNIVDQGLTNDNVVNTTVSTAFSAIFGSISGLTNAPVFSRRLTSRRLVATYTDTDVACTTCFNPIVHTRNAAVQKSAARAQAQEDQDIIIKEIVQKTNAIAEANAEYNLYKTEANLLVLNNAKTELQKFNSEKSILTTVITWINSGLAAGQTSSTTYLTNAQTDLSNATTALATAIFDKDTAFFKMKQAQHSLLYEEMKNNPNQEKITNYTNDIATNKGLYDTAITAVNTATYDKYVADKKIFYATNWVSDYWEYIPNSKWEPDIVDKIADHTAACNYCSSNRATYLSNPNRTLSDSNLTRPTLPNKYDDVKADVLEDIRRSISSINLDIMVVVQEIAKLSSNATTKENEAASIQRISNEIQKLFDDVKLFETNAIQEIQDLARYSRNRDAYEAFWDATSYTSNTTADFRIQDQDPWPEETTIDDICIAVLDKLFVPVTAPNTSYSTLNATAMLAKVLALQNELSTASQNGEPIDTFIDGKLSDQQVALQNYYEECDNLKLSYDKANQYDVHVSACQVQYPFGTYTNCTDARVAIAQRKVDNAITFDPPTVPTANTGSGGGGSTQSWAGLAPTKATGPSGTAHIIIDRMRDIEQRIASSVAAQTTTYGSARNSFYTKAFNTLKKYKVIGLPSGLNTDTKLDTALTETRTNCRTEIQKIVNATKWMINNNVAPIYLNSTHTISVNDISMPNNIADAIALHAFVLATAQKFTFVEGDTNTAALLSYQTNVETYTNGVGETTACEATGLEDIVINNEALPTDPVYRDTSLNTIKLNCLTGNAFDQTTNKCIVSPCSLGQYNRKTGAVGQCIACPAGQYSDTVGLQWVTGLSEDQATADKRDHSWKTDSSDNIITNLRCKSCPSGKFSSAGSTSCVSVVEGYYAVYDQSASAKCHQGSFAATIETQETSLSSVTASSSALTNSTGCTFTTPGHYTDLSGEQSQTVCAAGTWQDAHGKSSCKDAAIGHFVSGSGQNSQTTCSSQTSSNPSDSGTIKNRYTSQTKQTSCAICPAGSIVSDDYTSCITCQTLQGTTSDTLITQNSGKYYCRGDRDNGAVKHCNNDQATNFYVQYALNWDQPCQQRLCSCLNGNPQVGSGCSEKDSEECSNCAIGAGLYNKTDTQTGAIIWADSSQTIPEKVCRICSRPLFNNVEPSVSACAVESCPVGEGYPSTAPDMSAMTSADDLDGSFTGVICAACPPGSYSNSNVIGQCSKIPSGYGCVKNSKAYISTQVGLNADKTTNYTALRDLAAAKAIGAPYVPPFASEDGCEAIAKCPLGTYRARSSANVDVNDDSNFCKFIPRGYTCKVSGTCAGSTNCASATTAVTCSEKSIAGGNCVFTSGNTVPLEGCDEIELCARGTYSTGPLKEHFAGRKNEAVTTSALSNTCQAIPAGQECDLLNDGNQSAAYTGDVNTRSFALAATGCGSTRNCPRGLFRVSGSNDAKCSRIPLGKGCADHKANSLVRGRPSQYSDGDSPGCKTVAACDKGYFRGIGHLNSSANPISGTDGTVEDTWCTQCPVGHQCSDCGSTNPSNVPSQLSDSDDFTWIANTVGTGTHTTTNANECKSALPCATGYYKDTILLANTLCTIIPVGSYCKDPDKATSECKEAGQCGSPNMAEITTTTGQHQCTACPTVCNNGEEETTSCASPSTPQVCTACSAGTFGDGSTGCQDCPSGWRSGQNANSCTVCALGQYEDNNVCKYCTNGKYQDLTGQTTCKSCAAGKEGRGSTGAQSETAGCQNCQAGNYQASTGKTTCEVCEKGKYQDEDGKTTCDPCANGKHQASTGKTTCDSCAVGKEGKGSTGAQSESDGCTNCQAGTYQAQTGQTMCDPCAIGKYQDEDGKTTCDPCANGKHQASTGQSSCTSCDAGKKGKGSTGAVSETAGCEACAKGKSQASTGQTSCAGCVTGEYQDDTGQQTCKTLGDGESCNPYTTTTECEAKQNCASGWFRSASATPASNACASAQAGYKTSSLSAASAQVACQNGYYQDQTAQTTCKQTTAGHYAGAGVITSQTQCQTGEIAAASATLCTACLVNQIVDSVGSLCITCSDTVVTSNVDGTTPTTNAGLGSYPNADRKSCTSVQNGYFKNTAGTDQTIKTCKCDDGQSETGTECAVHDQRDCLSCNSGHGRYVIAVAGVNQNRFECVDCTIFSTTATNTAGGATDSYCALTDCPIGKGFPNPGLGGLSVQAFFDAMTSVGTSNNLRPAASINPVLNCADCADHHVSASNEVGQCTVCSQDKTHNTEKSACLDCATVTTATYAVSGEGCKIASCDSGYYLSPGINNGTNNNDGSNNVATGYATCVPHTTCGNDSSGNTRLTGENATAPGSCANCADNEYAATVTADCAACASGEYSTAGATSCSTCTNNLANTATVTCTTGDNNPTVVTCDTNYFNTDGNSANGCEAGCAVVTDGTCTACTTAVASGCTAVTCDTNYFNTDGNSTNGCEAGCAVVSGSMTCTACTTAVASGCTAATCDTNYFNTDGNSANGCEAGCAVVTDGTCTACTTAVASGCTAVTCDAGKFDTNGDATDGCEA